MTDPESPSAFFARTALFGVALFLCTLAGIAIRLQIVRDVASEMRKNQQALTRVEVPFSRESAIQFRQLRQYYNTGSLPERDPAIQWPEGVNIARTYTIGSERVYAPLMRGMPTDWSVIHRARTASVLWFCLGIPLLGLAGWKWFGSRMAGIIAALFYAISAASVIRSSGLELSSENFAFPLICGFLASEAFAAHSRTNGGHWLAAFFAAFCLAWAMCSWDMVQVMVILWAGVAYVQLFRNRHHPPDRRFFQRFAILVAFLGIAGWVNPYLNAHAFWRSPVLGFAAATACVGLWHSTVPGKPVRTIFVALLPWGGFISLWLLTRGMGDSYGHFGELLWAKIQFLNRKPYDPALLTFNQRILWTPALHSMTWALLKDYFPVLFLLTPIALGLYFAQRTSDDPRAPLFPAIFCLLSFATCVLFFRFHVYVILFTSLVVGGALAIAVRRERAHLWIPLGVALAAAAFMEAANTLRRAGTRWAAESSAAARYSNELLEWLKAHSGQAPVIANFTISGPIVSQAGNPVVLHPKYEDRVIRDRVEAYAMHLFRGEEKSFRDWCDSMKARYLVFALGEFSPDGVEMTPSGIRLKPVERTPQIKEFITGQMRYMADAILPEETAPAMLFLKRAMEESTARTHRGYRRILPMDIPRYFRYEWANEKYAVFRIISSKDQEMAEGFAEMAEIALETGDVPMARKRIISSLEYDPNFGRAYALLARIEQVRGQQSE